MTLSNSGLPYPIRCSATSAAQIELPGVPLGSFPGVTYDEVTLPLQADDVFVFCTDGIFEAMNEEGVEFGAPRRLRDRRAAPAPTARGIVDAMFQARHRVPRRRAAGRRHDGGRREDRAPGSGLRLYA